jgi:D-alanyl-lipoteichoic acid acyltransferase DltB (MBOAT superfamily)
VSFNSITFILFFALVLILHNLPLSWRTRKGNLLWLSYLFYAAWNPPFVLLIWISTIVDWVVARRISEARSPGARRALLGTSLALNLGLLGYFKYGAFALETFVELCAAAGVDYRPAAPSIILPVGISFYTFQTLSYTIDVYRGRIAPWTSFLDYALYVTFFPQLVAGPIVRSSTFLPQCAAPRRTTSRGLSRGAALLVFGLFQKVVLADRMLAPVADALYSQGRAADAVSAWIGTLAFAGQIFCDFAGYSTCAIGVALCLGFALPENFRAPYAAIGFSDFWRRWHISLSTWLRDYLYIPLGGSRRGASRTYLNLGLTMLIGGLWHGAAWSFVIWGGLHGLFLAAERLLTSALGHWRVWQQPAVRAGLAALTFALVCIAWTFFRAESIAQALQVSGAMLGLGASTGATLLARSDVTITLVTLFGILSGHWLMRGRSIEDLLERTPAWLQGAALGLMMTTIGMANGDDRSFIYFQF